MNNKVKLVGMTFAVKEFPSLQTKNPEGEVEFVRNTQYDKPEFGPDCRGIMVMSGDIRLGWIANKSDTQARLNKTLDAAIKNGVPVKGVIVECDYSSRKPWCEVAFEGEIKKPEPKKNEGNFKYYTKGGKNYLRLTSVLSRVEIEDDTSGLDNWKLSTFGSLKEYEAFMSQAATAGTNMHSALEAACELGVIEADDRGKIVDEIPKDKFDLLPDGFWTFLREECDGMEVLAIEETVFDDESGVAGTFDLLVKKDGKKIVLDWKSSKQVFKKHLVQTAWYAKRADADEAWVVAWGSKNKCGYQLKKVTSQEKMDQAVRIVKGGAEVIHGSEEFFKKG